MYVNVCDFFVSNVIEDKTAHSFIIKILKQNTHSNYYNLSNCLSLN